MRFVPILREFIIRRGPAGRHFQCIRGFIAEHFGYQAPQVSRSRRISHGESRSEAPFGEPLAANGRIREIAMDHRIASARPLGRALTALCRNVGGAAHGRTGVAQQQQPKHPRRNRSRPRNRRPRRSRSPRNRRTSSRGNPDSSRRAVISRSSCIRRG